MEWNDPRFRKPDQFDRALGLFALFCVAAAIVFMTASFLDSVERLRQRRAKREEILNNTYHEYRAMPRGHLDRG